jgi:hypothetical protein
VTSRAPPTTVRKLMKANVIKNLTFADISVNEFWDILKGVFPILRHYFLGMGHENFHRR